MLRSVVLLVFFFKQKTAYEMRISDWSSDVCSSDLDLAKLAATQFRDFANTVPGLVFQTAGAGNTQISMRGVTAGVDVSSTVGVYVDEVPYGSSTTFARSGRYTPEDRKSTRLNSSH